MARSNRSGLLRVVLIAVSMALIAAACTGTSPSATAQRELVEDPSDQDTGTDVSAVLPAPNALPPAFSTVRSVGDLGYYYAVVDDEMRLIAFDAASLEGRYQIKAHPLGRVRPVAQELVVDDELSIIFVTSTTDETSANAGFIAGHDASTGALIWRTAINYDSTQPRHCGPNLCVRSPSEQLVIDKASGQVVERHSVNDRLVLLDGPDLWLTQNTSPVGRFLELVATLPGERDVLWDLTFQEVEDAVGDQIDPTSGWRVDYDPARQAAIAYFAHPRQNQWLTLGLGTTTGEIIWTRDDFVPCVNSPFSAWPTVVCVAPDAGPIREIGLLNADTGGGQWTLPVDRSTTELLFDGTGLIAWQPSLTETTYQRIDLATGTASIGIANAICRVLNPPAELTLPNGRSAVWSAASNFTMCAPNGSFLAADDVVASAAQIGTELADFAGLAGWLVDESGVPLTPIG